MVTYVFITHVFNCHRSPNLETVSYMYMYARVRYTDEKNEYNYSFLLTHVYTC